MKNLLLSIFILPSLIVGSFVHYNTPEPQEHSDLRASRLMYNNIAQTYKTTRYEQAGTLEMVDYIHDNNLDYIQSTVNILPWLQIKNKWIYGDTNGNFMPTSTQWVEPDPKYVLLPKRGFACRTPMQWNCDFSVQGDVEFENEFWKLIKA